jgi:hypothetical protein
MTDDLRRLTALLSPAAGQAASAAADCDAVAVAASAGAHGVSALLWTALAGVGDARALRDALTPAARAAAALDVFTRPELQATLAALSAAGVRALVVKGAALAYTVYADPWLRPRTDADILVAPGEADAAIRALERRGYRRTDALTSGELVSHQLAFERTDDHAVRHVVDLHWKIVNPQMLAGALPFDTLWAAALPAPPLGPAARVPAPAASLAIAAVHRLAHHQGHERLIWLYDVLMLVRPFDDRQWAQLTALAVERRIAGLCLDALVRARDLVGSALPAGVEAALSAAAPAEPSRVYLAGAMRKRDVLLSDLSVLDWRSRLRLLREHAFPPAAFIRTRYRTHRRWPLAALYLHRLVSGAARWVRP